MNNRGITLISLTMYVAGISIIVIAVVTLTSFFYSNIVDLKDSADSLGEFDKFNVAFLKEIENNEVSVSSVGETEVVFSNGVTFQFKDNGIYKNYVKICDQVQDCQFSSTTMGENIVIKVYLEISTDFAKTLEYVGNNKQNNATNKRLILTKSTEEYTNGNVIVTLNYINLPEGYEIQYKIGDNQWTAGTSVTVEENNTVVYGRIYNNITLDEKDNNSIIITNIDKEAPSTASLTVETVGKTSIEVTARGEDATSGVYSYQFQISTTSSTSGFTIVETKTSTSSSYSYTYTGLAEGTTYYLRVSVTDRVGNAKTGTVVIQSTGLSESTSYVGYYADVDGNGSVDGVIYADLAIGGSGQWTYSDGTYSYTAKTNTKDYYISQTNYEGPFGTKDVLTAIDGEGEDRFYVMALEDFNTGTHYCWYYAAYGNMDDYATATSLDFGTGKANTEAMIAKWNSSAYGAQNDAGTYLDMWGAIQDKVAEGWFVPSRGEWGAFGDNLGITTDNYVNYGLSGWCWSSSQYRTFGAWYANFNDGYMVYDNVDRDNNVRLSATF